MTLDCFISYARRPLDEMAVRTIVTVLARHGLSVWWDGLLKHERGAALNEEIASHLRRSRVVVFVSSSQSLASPYGEAEVADAVECDKPLLKVEVEPAALPGRFLPLASAPTLRLNDYSDSEIGKELIAALATLGVAPSKGLDEALVER